MTVSLAGASVIKKRRSEEHLLRGVAVGAYRKWSTSESLPSPPWMDTCDCGSVSVIRNASSVFPLLHVQLKPAAVDQRGDELAFLNDLVVCIAVDL